MFLGQPHGVEGGEIVWFLVDMHNLRAYLAHDLAQVGVEVQVKVTVEHHRRDDHLVALGIEAFQHLLASIIAAPVCRSDEGQLDTRTFRQFFKFALRGPCNQGF